MQNKTAVLFRGDEMNPIRKKFSSKTLDVLRQAKELYPSADYFCRSWNDTRGVNFYHYEKNGRGFVTVGRIACEVDDTDFEPDVLWSIDKTLGVKNE